MRFDTNCFPSFSITHMHHLLCCPDLLNILSMAAYGGVTTSLLYALGVLFDIFQTETLPIYSNSCYAYLIYSM